MRTSFTYFFWLHYTGVLLFSNYLASHVSKTKQNKKAVIRLFVKDLCCGSHPLSHSLESCAIDFHLHLLYFLSLTTGCLPSAFKSACVSLLLKTTSPDSPIALQPSRFSSQPNFLELPTLCLYFLTSHSLLIPLTYYIEPLEPADIIDSTPIISPNLLNWVFSDLYIYFCKRHILPFNSFT